MSKEFNRRQAISLIGMSLSSVIVSACSDETQQKLQQTAETKPNPAPAPVPVPRIVEKPIIEPSPGSTRVEYTKITKTFPEKTSYYSTSIKENNLIPQILPEQQWAFDRMKAGVKYLEHAKNALERNQRANMPSLARIHAISNDNHPINFSPLDTPLTVLENFFYDLEQGNVINWGGSQSNVPYLMGVIGVPEYTAEKGWRMIGQIHANASFPFGPESIEEGKTTYNNFTDLQVALKMVHEYAHVKQSQALLTQALSTISTLNPDIIRNTIDQIAKNTNDRLNKDPRIDRRVVTGYISFNEMQANLIAQSVLYALHQLNDGQRLPGTQDDSFPTQPSSLFQTYKRAVLMEQNNWDTQWLNHHANWYGKS